MIVDLKAITDVPRHFDFSIGPDWWTGGEENATILGLDGPMDVRITLYRAGSKYVLEGRLSGSVLVSCDRCLEPCGCPVKSDFRVFLALLPKDADNSEVELDREDMSVDFVAGDEIELDDVIREQIYLSLPMKFLCREDCAGLCPSCGVDLNTEKCQCSQGKGHPAFSKLKRLKINGDKV